MMTENSSAQVNDFFTVRARDVAPLPARNTTQVLYLPVSPNQEATWLCATVLSDYERHRADRFATEAGKALFIQRRAFRRYCGALALGSSPPLSRVIFSETKNGRPHLADLPTCWFSFSSCRLGILGAWSATHGVGVDLEDQTRKVEVMKLAQQFFSVAEARSVEVAKGLLRLQTFFQLWCLKEAALKSIGEGLPFGLDTFEFELKPRIRIVTAPQEHGGPEQFEGHEIEGADGCAALVIRGSA